MLKPLLLSVLSVHLRKQPRMCGPKRKACPVSLTAHRLIPHQHRSGQQQYQQVKRIVISVSTAASSLPCCSGCSDTGAMLAVQTEDCHALCFSHTRCAWSARWDASEVYGTTEERAALLRVGGTQCEMRVDEDGFMPLNATDGVPEGGAAHVCCCLHSQHVAGTA